MLPLPKRQRMARIKMLSDDGLPRHALDLGTRMAGETLARNEVAEMAMKFLSRMIACALVGTGAMVGSLAPPLAADKVTFLTSLFAHAEHGGFYQTKPTGLYYKAG